MLLISLIRYSTKPSQMLQVMNGLNDYRCMWVEKPGDPQTLEALRPHHVNAWHQAHLLYLWKAIKQAQDDHMPCIVMTHHMPSLQLIAPQYQDSPLNFAFATPLEDLLARKPVCAVVCGHSHARQMVVLQGADGYTCPAYLNACGYPQEGQVDAAFRKENCLVHVILPCQAQ
jgi:hypothetical protein